MKRLLVLFTALSILLLIVLPACGGGGGEKTLTPTRTVTPTASLTATATPVSIPTATPVTTATPTPTAAEGPVKIGCMTAWSGPSAMAGMYFADPVIKLVEKQVKDQGGILGGREVQCVRYDTGGSVAQAGAGAVKLLTDDNVSVICWGGAGASEIEAVGTFAEQNKILFVPFAIPFGYQGTTALNPTFSYDDNRVQMALLLNKVLKPKTIGIIAADDAHDSRLRVSQLKPDLAASGINIVYEQYSPLDTLDYSSYLTKLKYANPDVVYLDFTSNEPYLTIAKQMMELGGWGNMKVMTMSGAEAAKKLTGAQGWYLVTPWLPDSQYPASQKFVQDFQALNGNTPNPNQVYFYNSLWTAIYAIKLAGTDADRAKIIQVSRSGNLEWDTPMGYAHFGADGLSGLQETLARVEEKTVVSVVIPQ